MAFILKEKLRGLKSKLIDWNKAEFGNVEVRVSRLVEDIKDLDLRGELGGLTPLEVTVRKDLFVELWKFKEASIFQRSKSKWLLQGDANSKFFHASVVARRKRNSIMALKEGNTWLESPSQIREAVENYFTNHFMNRSSIHPNLDGVSFPSLTSDDNYLLSAPFSLEEIFEVVKESDGNKSPGPDGFNFSFLKTCWDLIKGEVRIMFDQFHGIGSLPKSFLSYFVTLIPKVNLPFEMGDFRPKC
jgi:hypothetical protein